MIKTDAERIFHSGTSFSSNFKKGEACKEAGYLWTYFLKDNWLSDFFILLTKWNCEIYVGQEECIMYFEKIYIQDVQLV